MQKTALKVNKDLKELDRQLKVSGRLKRHIEMNLEKLIAEYMPEIPTGKVSVRLSKKNPFNLENIEVNVANDRPLPGHSVVEIKALMKVFAREVKKVSQEEFISTRQICKF